VTRYFFHLWTGAEYQRDECGTELDSAEAAYMEAFEAAQELAISMIRDRQNAALPRFEVTDERDRLIFELPFVEVTGSRASRHPLEATLTRGRTLAASVAEQVSLARGSLRSLSALLKA
jgi:hypothetical protein